MGSAAPDRTFVFEPVMADISHNDSFLTTKSVCQLIEKDVLAVIAINLEHLDNQVASILNYHGIPLLQVNPSILWENQITQFNSSINLYPSRRVISELLVDIVHDLKWEPISIFYQYDQDLLLWRNFLGKPKAYGTLLPMYIKLPQTEVEMVSMLVNLKHSAAYTEQHNMVLFVESVDLSTQFLSACQTSGLLNTNSNLLISSLGLTQRVLKPYMYSGANISYLGLANDIYSIRENYEGDFLGDLIHDALKLLVLNLGSGLIENFPTNLSCLKNQAWPHGSQLQNLMRETQFLGRTGVVNIDQYGDRTDVEVVIKELNEEKESLPVILGSWSATSGLMWKESNRGHRKMPRLLGTSEKHSLIITTVLSEPYAMLKKTSEKLEGNDKYEGFVVDLAREIASIVGFNYTIVPTNSHGSVDKNGRWNGMIREILEERADMAMADLTINYQREMVVDFTMPFLDLGISVLYVKAPEKAVSLFAFLSPLSANVWLLMIMAGIAVSLAMFVIAKLSPYETLELTSTDEGETPFKSFHHCLWFSIASWVQQGSDFVPRAISGRTVASFWWFFTLIMISSYTANLAAFLTIERMEAPINSVDDLAKQSKIKYGCLQSGSTNSFFKESNDELYQKLYRVMSRDSDEVMMNSNKEGIDKVLTEQGGYAFFMESTTIEYVIERYCQLQQVGGLLDSKSYGIAVQHGSPLRGPLSHAIIKLNEMGRIPALKNKWWKKERGGGTCEEEENSGSGVEALNLINVGGIFLVLLIGLILGLAMATFEKSWNACAKKRKFT